MLKLTNTLEQRVEIHTPKPSGGWDTTMFPVIYRIVHRERWAELQAQLIGDGGVELDVDPGRDLTNLSTRVVNISEALTDSLEEIVIGVPEGTKVAFDDGETDDATVIRQALLSNPFAAKAIFEHYAGLMNGEGRRKNSKAPRST